MKPYYISKNNDTLINTLRDFFNFDGKLIFKSKNLGIKIPIVIQQSEFRAIQFQNYLCNILNMTFRTGNESLFDSSFSSKVLIKDLSQKVIFFSGFIIFLKY